MLIPRTPPEQTGLEKAIDDLLKEMASVSCDTEEYEKMADQLVKLYKLKKIDSPQRVSYDTIAVIAGNLLGIMLIVGYERANILSSKALSFVAKLR